jgi:hypothetical protein
MAADGGAPTFSSSVVAISSGASYSAVADFNDDGKPDVAGVESGSASVRVALSTSDKGGSLSFSAPAMFTVGSAPQRVTAGDVNGDDKPDLVVSLGDSDRVVVLVNTTKSGSSSVSFEVGRSFSTASGPRDLVLSDFNGDGKLDVAVVCVDDGAITALANTTSRSGTPTFATAQTIRVGKGLNGLAVADFDGDERPDLAVASGGSGTVRVFHNVPGGSRDFQLQDPVDVQVGGWTGPLSAADLDSDGLVDLAVVDRDHGAVILLRNQTAAGTGIPDLAVLGSLSAGKRPLSMAAADVNNDGTTDLLVGGADAGSTVLLINTTPPGGEVTFGVVSDSTIGAIPRGLVVADLNRDDRPDVLVSNPDARTRALRNQSSGSGGRSVTGAPLASPGTASISSPPAVSPPSSEPPASAAVDTATPASEAVLVASSPANTGVGECGPPSTTIPGPPPEIIRVGQPMPESWLRCYVWQDLIGQDYAPEAFESVDHVYFRGYPVECWNALGSTTEGLILRLLAWGDQGRQHVRFTYRIQMDGDYINNCAQEIIG